MKIFHTVSLSISLLLALLPTSGDAVFVFLSETFICPRVEAEMRAAFNIEDEGLGNEFKCSCDGSISFAEGIGAEATCIYEECAGSNCVEAFSLITTVTSRNGAETRYRIGEDTYLFEYPRRFLSIFRGGYSGSVAASCSVESEPSALLPISGNCTCATTGNATYPFSDPESSLEFSGECSAQTLFP